MKFVFLNIKTFLHYKNIHCKNTRSALNFYIPLARTNKGVAPSNLEPKIFNKVTKEIKNLYQFSLFKRQLKY